MYRFYTVGFEPVQESSSLESHEPATKPDVRHALFENQPTERAFLDSKELGCGFIIQKVFHTGIVMPVWSPGIRR